MLSIRPAVAHDVALLKTLIHEFAEFEHDRAFITEEGLLRDGFGASPKFRALVAEWDSQPAGYALLKKVGACPNQICQSLLPVEARTLALSIKPGWTPRSLRSGPSWRATSQLLPIMAADISFSGWTTRPANLRERQNSTPSCSTKTRYRQL